MGDLTEASWGTYARQLLNNALSNTTPQLDGSALTEWPDVSFLTNTGSGQTVFGYFVLASDGLTVLWSERFASPITDGMFLVSFQLFIELFGLSSFTG